MPVGSDNSHEHERQIAGQQVTDGVNASDFPVVPFLSVVHVLPVFPATRTCQPQDN